MLRKILRETTKRFGVRILKYDGNYDSDGFFTHHSDAFRKEPGFRAAYGRGLRTVSHDPGHEWRVHIALWAASVAAKLPGDFVECGVFVGFISSAVMTDLDWDKTGKTFFLIDTFAGPETDQFTAAEVEKGRLSDVERLRKIGGYDYSLESVARNFREWRNVRLIKGLVPDVLPQCPASKIAYLHIDMNCAAPEVAALRFFWDKLVTGGIVLLDDYAYRGFEEQRLAMNALAGELGFKIASLPTGQGLIVKT